MRPTPSTAQFWPAELSSPALDAEAVAEATLATTLVAAVATAAAFRGLYWAAARLDRPRPSAPQYTSRYVSTVHAVVLVALGLAPRGAWWPCAARAVPLGYLAHDAALLFAEPCLWDLGTAAHHLVFALLVAAAAAAYPAHTARAFLAEASVPALNLGWMMVRTGADRRHPYAFGFVSVMLLCTFASLRVWAFTALLLESVAEGVWGLAPLLLGLAAVNWYWFGLLLLRARRAIARA